MAEFVTIHGDQWKLSDIQEDIDWCLKQSWTRRKWEPPSALVDKMSGRVSLYCGQKYDPSKVDLVKGAWNHDHCAICWFTLWENEETDSSVGWKDADGNWLCSECYDLFIRPKLAGSNGMHSDDNAL